MDRRAFLQVLGAVGVLTGMSTWLTDPIARAAVVPSIALPDVEDADVSEWLDTTDLAVEGRATSLFEVFMANESASVARLTLKRFPENGGHTLVQFAAGPGGIVRWISSPGEEIYGPVRIIVPEGVQAYVIGSDSMGRTVMASQGGVVLMKPPILSRHAQQRQMMRRAGLIA